jgi:LmbE family N-acetylglucosaminyl deacetylase
MRAADVLESFRHLPIAPLELLAPGPVVVLAPHPDDESLGCGGLISLACKRGVRVHVVFLTDGSASHPDSDKHPPPALAALRRAEAEAACAELGLAPGRLRFLGVRDGRAPHSGGQFDALASALATLIRTAGAGTLFSAWAHDPHADHLAAHLIAAEAARRTGARLLSYPIWGWTLPPDLELPPVTGRRLDVSGELAAKRRAIAAHRSQTTDLIDDDPGGFRLAPEMIALLTGSHEVFLDG